MTIRSMKQLSERRRAGKDEAGDAQADRKREATILALFAALIASLFVSGRRSRLRGGLAASEIGAQSLGEARLAAVRSPGWARAPVSFLAHGSDVTGSRGGVKRGVFG